VRLTVPERIDQNRSYMSKLNPSITKSWQALPYTLMGAILFAWVSSAHLNPYLSIYLALLAAQLGTVGIYLVMRRLKSPKSSMNPLIGRIIK
jgi:hypothetical protein